MSSNDCVQIKLDAAEIRIYDFLGSESFSQAIHCQMLSSYMILYTINASIVLCWHILNLY